MLSKATAINPQLIVKAVKTTAVIYTAKETLEQQSTQNIMCESNIKATERFNRAALVYCKISKSHLNKVISKAAHIAEQQLHAYS